MAKPATEAPSGPAPRVARLLFWGWVAIQLVVPTIQLVRAKPALFSWQMYSRQLTPYRFEVVSPDGDRRRIDLDAYVTIPREEIPWHTIIPEHICTGLRPGTTVEASIRDERHEWVCD